MKYETKNSFGKRMVRESKIKEIGQGGGTTYTAGDGIDITENVISLENPINEVNVNTIKTNGVYINNGEEDVIQIHPGSNANFLYVINNDLPFEISSYKGSWIRFENSGLVTLCTVDGQSAVTYTFKADGIYIGNTKITN